MTQESTTNIVKKFYTNGEVEDVNEKMTLAEMQAFVGGDIEFVRTRVSRRSLVVNEEGTIENLPPNVEASKVIHPEVLVLDFIRGNALLVKG